MQSMQHTILVVCSVSILQIPEYPHISLKFTPKKGELRGFAWFADSFDEASLLLLSFDDMLLLSILLMTPPCFCYSLMTCSCYPPLALAFASSQPTGFVSSTSVISRFDALYSILAYYSRVPLIHPIPCLPSF